MKQADTVRSEPSPHPAIVPGKVAFVTGGASGIGLAVATKLLEHGMRVALIDRHEDGAVPAELSQYGDNVCALNVDVADRTALDAAADRVERELGLVAVVMNNAAIGGGGDVFGDPAGWARLLAVNLLGVVHGCSIFAPRLVESGQPGLIVNTGSKQGITQPPGNTAYNVAKAGVKALTEGLAHSLREKSGDRVTAHLLIPGFTYTGMIARHVSQKPPAAWTAQQVAEYLFARLQAGDFYILCPDNETTLEADRKRIAWAAGDLIENRPALSRWHPDFKDAFEQFLAS